MMHYLRRNGVGNTTVHSRFSVRDLPFHNRGCPDFFTPENNLFSVRMKVQFLAPPAERQRSFSNAESSVVHHQRQLSLKMFISFKKRPDN